MKKAQIKIDKMKKQGSTEDSTLKRTTGDAAAEKYRCTYEARHVVTNYLDIKDPGAMNWRGALVVKGAVHVRLSNINVG